MSPKPDKLRLAAQTLVDYLKLDERTWFLTQLPQFIELVTALEAPIETKKTVHSHGKRATTAGYREDINLTVRSRWEANVARYLNWLQVKGKVRKWRYEPQRFWFESIKSGTRSYLPDFWVEKPNGSSYWLEVKGYWDPKSKTAVKRFAKYFPDEILVIIASAEYKELEQKFKDEIPDWELP